METYTIRAAAERCGVSYQSMRKRVDRGALEVIKQGGRRLISRSELERVGLWPDTPPERIDAEIDRLRAENAQLESQLIEYDEQVAAVRPETPSQVSEPMMAPEEPIEPAASEEPSESPAALEEPADTLAPADPLELAAVTPEPPKLADPPPPAVTPEAVATPAFPEPAEPFSPEPAEPVGTPSSGAADADPAPPIEKSSPSSAAEPSRTPELSRTGRFPAGGGGGRGRLQRLVVGAAVGAIAYGLLRRKRS